MPCWRSFLTSGCLKLGPTVVLGWIGVVGSDESRWVGSARLDRNLHWLDRDGTDGNLADTPTVPTIPDHPNRP